MRIMVREELCEKMGKIRMSDGSCVVCEENELRVIYEYVGWKKNRLFMIS